MQKYLPQLFVLFILVFLVIGLNQRNTQITTQEHISENPPQKVIYYIPHQDDETLFLGIAIANDIENNNDVKVVILTNGSNTGVRKTLGFTKEHITNIRNKEFVKALETLGVKNENIYFRQFEDGNLTLDQVEEVIKEFNDDQNIINKTLSYTDFHTDHKVLGNALLNLYKNGIVKNAYFYIRYENLSKYQGQLEPSNEKTIYKVRKACDVYGYNDPANDWYPIGYLSVRSIFDKVYQNPINKYHLPNGE